MITMYGIPNCDSIKKAQRWLDQHGQSYQFHNYKKDGITTELLRLWIAQTNWEVILNKRSTTWRKLSKAQKTDLNSTKAIALMCDHNSLIKRPILIIGDHIEVGFSERQYEVLFS